ncbi:hypothetical protein CNEO4_1930017 [Clostridium neonatale]|uniref:Uncharacterized protein n=1 Tax=Clostridium neonatale TaxID=137838 RepID=A0AA86JGW8_9CLOT|nr:hypothetical protein CNEO_40271 [Clostridium neonatale]CAG9713662.1 hypothetical protein CNEO_570034 [Clostridium neonatale]CAI3192221.1 hypothetical protein CNEO2_100120 [Clostridium neonatale]CAI3196039.1 hypothetical protein CNEO2_130023 [Clostridium neonatale]CAI3196868.1 hypothetical protein CNEO2_180022 [Clostridium neonatale]
MKLGCYNLSILVFILSINNDIIYNKYEKYLYIILKEVLKWITI